MTQEELVRRLRELLFAPEGQLVERVQTLWGGYGAIHRFVTHGAFPKSYIVKCVTPPVRRQNVRLGLDVGHERKLASYRVEANFYQNYAPLLGPPSRVPRAFHVNEERQTWLFVLEDLDAAGYAERRSRVSRADVEACLAFLAHFHARFLSDRSEGPASFDGLWEVGTYWHLATRQEELRRMGDRALRSAAVALDKTLSRARFQTLVHGDAKLENFCFSAQPDSEVAAVDFQYVGGGVGVKDVAYLFSSCFDDDELELHADALLDNYFALLRAALGEHAPGMDAFAVEREWRDLYPLAWADFLRFLDGWAPGQRPRGYSKRMVMAALSLVGSRTVPASHKS